MEIKQINCPNCGAPLNKNLTECDFCKSKFYIENNNTISINSNATGIPSCYGIANNLINCSGTIPFFN